MSVLLVSYALNAPGQNYTALIQAIQQYIHVKALKSMWFIDTSETAEAVRDKLMRFIDASDLLFVMRLRPDWGANRVTPATDWLNHSGRTWD